MKWWPFKKEIVDERIVHTRNMLFKETYIVVVLLCFVSIIVKYIYYGQTISMITTELVILIVTSLYFGIRSILLGLYSDEVEVHDRKSNLPMSIKNVIWGVVLGVALAVWFGIRSAINYANSDIQSIWYFIIVFIASLMIYTPLFVIVIVSTHYYANKVSNKAAREDQDE